MWRHIIYRHSFIAEEKGGVKKDKEEMKSISFIQPLPGINTFIQPLTFVLGEIQYVICTDFSSAAEHYPASIPVDFEFQ